MYINPVYLKSLPKGSLEKKGFELPSISKDGKNKSDFFVADVVANKRFVLNYAGFVRNDISIINEQTDINVAKALVESLTVLPTLDGYDNDVEAMLSHRSKYCQTPSEGAEYVRQQMELRLERERSSKEKEIEFTDSDKQVVDNV